MKVKAVFVPLRWEGACVHVLAPSPGREFDSAWEHACWDPKDGELCLCRAKPGETLVEARSASDVQIDRQTWV